MKQVLLICASAALLAVASCTKQEDAPMETALRFRIDKTLMSRAATNYTAADYFGLSELGNATVVVKSTVATYAYADGILAAATDDDCLYFPVDGSALASVKVRWPEDTIRTAQGGTITKDQSTKAAFFAADWLSAELKNLTPVQTATLTFSHERPKVTFSLTGAQAGKKIISLTIAGSKAYCDASPDIKDAQLILSAGNTDIKANAIGILGIEGDNTLRNFKIQTMPALVAGDNHTIQITF